MPTPASPQNKLSQKVKHLLEVPGATISERTDPISKAAAEFPLDYVERARKRFNFMQWQLGGDDSVYYNMHIPEFFQTGVAMPSAETSVLERNLKPHLKKLTFEQRDGSRSPELEDYIHGPNRVQAMIMTHKGKVVFEAYPGMKPTQMHVWMSASKTTTSAILALLEEEGKVDFSAKVPTYVPQLEGTAWDDITLANAANMATGLDIEEKFDTLLDPDSWIATFFSSVMGEGGPNWLDLLKSAKKLPDEPPGAHMRYSSAVTMVLVLAAQNIENKLWVDIFRERIWARFGAKYPAIVGLTPDGVPVGFGLINSIPEDFVRYALLYTPSWNVVANERVISEKVLARLQTLGDPAAFEGSTEQDYGAEWFGEPAERNSAQWDDVFADGAMFKHGNMGQGIYVDPNRDFAGIYFSLCPNQGPPDHSPGYLRAAAKVLSGN